MADGTIWYTLHWLDLYSRRALGQVTAQSLNEDLVIQSFLSVAQQNGLPGLLKTDHDTLWYDADSGLPSRLTRVLAALGIHHLLVGPKQPWWNGVVERYIQTCRREVHLPAQGDSAGMNQALETARQFYYEERCHSRCQDQPPATVYQSSPRHLPPGFDPTQVPITSAPTVVTEVSVCILFPTRLAPGSARKRSIGVGRTDWLRSPLPPNRTGGSPASGSPVGGFTSKRIDEACSENR